jgi:hypothetical protein
MSNFLVRTFQTEFLHVSRNFFIFFRQYVLIFICRHFFLLHISYFDGKFCDHFTIIWCILNRKFLHRDFRWIRIRKKCRSAKLLVTPIDLGLKLYNFKSKYFKVQRTLWYILFQPAFSHPEILVLAIYGPPPFPSCKYSDPLKYPKTHIFKLPHQYVHSGAIDRYILTPFYSPQLLVW